MPPDADKSGPVYFVDRSLGGKVVVDALKAAGASVLAHDEVFSQDTPDITWLSASGAKGWVVLTKDSAIRRNPLERNMYRESKARVFALTRKDLSGQQMAEIFVAALPGMKKRVDGVEPPFLFSISMAGEFTLLD